MNGITDTDTITGANITSGEAAGSIVTNEVTGTGAESNSATDATGTEASGNSTPTDAAASATDSPVPAETTAKKSPAKPKGPLPTVGSIITGHVLAATTDKPYVLIKLEGGHIGLLHESRVQGVTRDLRNKRMAGFKKDEELRLAVLDVSDEEPKPRISLSEREAQVLDLLAKLAVGTVVTGTVANKQLYGAFIDLGDNVHGLLHVKQMPGDNATERKEFLEGLTDGQEVTVKVASVKREDNGKPRIDLELAAE